MKKWYYAELYYDEDHKQWQVCYEDDGEAFISYFEGLQKLGEKGWELVAVENSRFFLKLPR
jgi:hypothetical protein